jgi:NAF domain
MQLFRPNELNCTHVCQDNHVKEKKDEQPAAMNAFELIALSKGLHLENLFDIEKVRTSRLQT